MLITGVQRPLHRTAVLMMPALALTVALLGAGSGVAEAKPRAPRPTSLPAVIEGCCTVWITAPRMRRR